MTGNDVTRGSFGMQANSASGFGPALTGACTLLGKDARNRHGEDPGDNPMSARTP